MKIRPVAITSLAVCSIVVCLAQAEEEERVFKISKKPTASTQKSEVVPGLETREQKAAYRIGRRDGATYKSHNLDREALMRGIRDVMDDKASPIPASELDAAAAEMTEQSVMSVMGRYKSDTEKERQAFQAVQTKPAADEKPDAGRQFLDKNRSEDGVICTPSGLQFIILKQGKGAPPRAHESVTVHYRGTLLDGTEFDSSYSRKEPAKFAVGAVIKGWTEALQMMKPGSKFKLFIPPEIGYGPAGSPPKIPGNSVLVFEVELLGVNKD